MRVVLVVCGWFVGVCDTPWVVACLLGFWGVGLWVVCVFAGGGVCSSLAASRGGGRLGPVGVRLVCGGGLRTQERVLCYFTSHLIASGAGPAPFVRGCRWA